MPSDDIALRPATRSDARDIARIMRAARGSFAWMPTVHTPKEYLAFISETVLPLQRVTVAESGEGIVGFIAVHGEWVGNFTLSPPGPGVASAAGFSNRRPPA